MEKIAVKGRKALCGKVKVQGAKNSILPILAATLMVDGVCSLKNTPWLLDVSSCVEIMQRLNATIVSKDDTLRISKNHRIESSISKELMSSMRSSIFFLAPLIASTGIAAIYQPGGCELGGRPIDLHLDGLTRMGVVVRQVGEKLLCYAENGLYGADIMLRFPSVGATETLLMAASTAKGTTVIRNAAKEPEVKDLVGFLRSAGADITGEGSSVITVNGVSSLTGTQYSIIPDRIETATYLCATASTGGEIEVERANPKDVEPLIELLSNAGANITVKGDSIFMCCEKRLNGVGYIETQVFPGFPTDAAPLLASAMLKSKGKTVIHDTIFCDRFRCADEFSKFGATANRLNSSVMIEGVQDTYAADVKAVDLRGGAALLVAALGAEGESVIDGVDFIRRGYQNIVNSYRLLGANIKYC